MNRSWSYNDSGFPAELKTMLTMLAAAVQARPQEPRRGPPRLPAIDWNQFQALVRHHRIYPLLDADPGASELIPSDVRQAVERECRANALRMLRLSAEAERVCGALAQRGVRSLLLKGPALAHHLYGDVSLRTSKDLDILIPVADVALAERVLRELGYRAERPIPRGLGDWKWKIHHVAFRHPELRIEVEVHWRLNGDIGKEPPFETLWRGRQVSELSPGLHMPGDEQLFLYLVTHGARHGWFRLRWLADIDRMARRSLDWGEVLVLLKRYHAVHLAGQALALASLLLHTPIPRAMRAVAAGTRGRELAQRALGFIRDGVVLSTDPSAGDVARMYKSYLFALKTKPQRWRYAVTRLYPSFRDAEALPLPKPLYFLYFPLRPFVWLWRQVRQLT